MNDRSTSAAFCGPGGDLARLLRGFNIPSLGLAAVGIVLTVVFGDLPGQGRYAGVLQDSCHAPAFATLSLIAFTLLARHGQRQTTKGAPRTSSAAGAALTQALTVVVIMLFIGAGTELLQGLLGRDAEVDDVISDVVGAGGMAAIWVYATLSGNSSSGSRWGRLATVLICAGLATWWVLPLAHCGLAYWTRDARFPVLAQFQSPSDLYFVSTGPPPPDIVPIQHAATETGPATALRLVLDKGRWPGMTLLEPVPDWRRFHELLLDLSNRGTVAVPLRLRINDAEHNGAFNDRFNIGIPLAPKARTTLRIPLESIAHGPLGRPMDLSRIAQLSIFRDGAAPAQTVLVHRIWLQ